VFHSVSLKHAALTGNGLKKEIITGNSILMPRSSLIGYLLSSFFIIFPLFGSTVFMGVCLLLWYKSLRAYSTYHMLDDYMRLVASEDVPIST
jgi:hypothetical protein